MAPAPLELRRGVDHSEDPCCSTGVTTWPSLFGLNRNRRRRRNARLSVAATTPPTTSQITAGGADGVSLAGKGSQHKRMWNAYRLDPDARRKQIGINGERLHKRRKMADYKDTFPNLSVEAGLVVAAVSKLIAEVDSL